MNQISWQIIKHPQYRRPGSVPAAWRHTKPDLPPESDHHRPAVQVVRLPGDVIRIGSRQEHRDAGQILRLLRAPHGDAAHTVRPRRTGHADDKKVSVLSEKEIADGMIALFDGESTFGWKVEGDAKVEGGKLILGDGKATTLTHASSFGPFACRILCESSTPFVKKPTLIFYDTNDKKPSETIEGNGPIRITGGTLDATKPQRRLGARDEE